MSIIVTVDFLCGTKPSNSFAFDPSLQKVNYTIPQASSGSTLGSPPSWNCLKNHQGEAPWRHPVMPESSQLASFHAMEQWL